MNRFIMPLIIGYLMDMVLGDPYCVPHPVCAMGWFINCSEKFIRRILPQSPKWERAGGFFLVLLVVSTTAMVSMGIIYIAQKISYEVQFVVQCIMCWQCIAQKSLKKESMKVYTKLKEKNIEGARTAVSMIVGRDTQSLTREGITKATVETVAENTSDGVIAPIIYMAIGGGVLGCIYKAINTMDSMIGYKNEKYLEFGFAAAKLDDIVNFIPSRISGLIMMLAAFVAGLDGKNAWFIFKRDRLNHASPNSAHTEAACAGALGVQLAGDAWYFGKLYKKKTIGDSLRKIDDEDIIKADKLMEWTSFLTMLVIIALNLVF
ncbi:MAG: adenosylcobinamide-phosphate synthase CbiB [Lachnospiraceae bacterium]|nr:adenosylcobinamide-phosphate synthase CbiB [Lachnospiraceae bacterium]